MASVSRRPPLPPRAARSSDSLRRAQALDGTIPPQQAAGGVVKRDADAPRVRPQYPHARATVDDIVYGHDVEGTAPARPNLNRNAAGKGSAVLNSAFSGYDHAPAKHMGGRGFVLDDYAVANRSQRQIDAKVRFLHRTRGPRVSIHVAALTPAMWHLRR